MQTNKEENSFLNDNSFLLWRLAPTEESNEYWMRYIELHPEQAEQIQEAIKTLTYLKINEITVSDTKLETLYSKIVIKAQRRRLFINIYRYSAIACVFILCTVLFSVYFHNTNNYQSVPIAKTDSTYKDIQLFIGKEKTITLADKSSIQYNKSGNLTVKEKGTISDKSIPKQNQMNVLVVPMGKRTSLILTDGTKIWLNSGTRIEFPTIFDREIRKIIVSGEIYIEVAKDANRPFIVQTNEFNVKILGTQFNLTSYSDETTKSVVLVEGSVEIETNNNQKVCLHPGQMMELEKDMIRTLEVNVENYTSWKDGVLYFKSESLGKILDRISRYYGVTIEYDEKTGSKICSGELVLFDRIEDVFDTIKDIYPIKYSQLGKDNVIKVYVKL